MDAAVIGKTIAYGAQTWRVLNGKFYVQTFGWHPTGPNPRYSWRYVDDTKVPQSVKDAV